jgi:septal ring factor EnvC (AmiA/AmiB activator)
MFQKLFFGAAAAVTAFALVLLGGVLAQVGPVAASGNEAAVQAQAAQQAAAYQQVIATANSQLAQSYQQQQSLQQQLGQAQQKLADTQQQLADTQQQLTNVQQQAANTQPDGNTAAASTLTVDQAASLAQQLVPRGRMLQQPVMVNLQGRAAYEVKFDLGTLYLDPASGQVLAAVPASQNRNGAAPQGGDDN